MSRRLGTRLAWAALLLMVGLVCTAAIKPQLGLGGGIGISGHQHGFKGGPPAGWDTLLAVYSTRTGMGDTAIASAAYDTFNARWQVKKGAADAVVRWGSDDLTFAYALIDTYYSGVGSWPTTASRATELRPKAMGWGSITYPTPATTRWALTDSTGGVHGRSLLVHFDPKIPDNSTVVSAKLHIMALNWTMSAVSDTLVATLMTAPADSVWWRHKGINDNGSNTAANMSKASYRYQWFATGSSPNYGYTNTGNGNTPTAGWYPALSTRARWWQWGDVSDWTPGAGLSAASGDVAIDVTNCVQAIVRGDVNNGIHITGTKSTTSDRLRRIINFDTSPTGGSAFYVPWLEVKYITKRYSYPFPGNKDIAFVWQTDDGKQAFNDSLADAFLDHGGRYTMFLCDSLSMNVATSMDYSHAATLHDQGFEIGWHSRRHRTGPSSAFLTVYERAGATAAGYDSLRVEMSPQTMYNRAAAIGRPDLEDSPLWGKSMALPGYPFSPWILQQAEEYGYNALRVGSAGFYSTTSHNRVLPSYRPARCDTAWAAVPYGNERAPRNLMLVPLTTELDYIVGAKANTTITEDQVRFNLRRLMRQAKATKRPSVVLYEHDFKSGSYTLGVDPEEMRWMLKEAVAQNAWICTTSDYAKWLKSGATAIDTPAGYGQTNAAYADSFEFVAGERVWFKPHGIGQRWIRGVK